MRTIVWVAMVSKNIRLVGLHLHTSRGKSFLQCEFIGSRWVTQTIRHSNEAGDPTAGT